MIHCWGLFVGGGSNTAAFCGGYGSKRCVVQLAAVPFVRGVVLDFAGVLDGGVVWGGRVLNDNWSGYLDIYC